MANYCYIILAALLVLATTHRSTAIPAGSTPAKRTPKTLSAAEKDFLDAHNEARAAVGVAPLAWSQALTTAASRFARYQRNQKNCEFANLNRGKYGANQLWVKGMAMPPRSAVEAWVNEKEFYDYGTDTCAANHTCAVYKQVVWRNSKELGCAQATCPKDSTVLTICLYNPPGNIDGQKPY
ncbi:PREDICTED: STS14 protein [Tarenaya hassleriana]|uniref:STS14 protein n=1 Tax=Tarenaya hassleriana TaxID=28532 RepID=UPI00053C2A45|nr:PREDICTED: STS14 protein [Tarenaya hassleriana]XP_010557989.1 PREDICTED: STS14 protein [Tarenaya hassleriana]